ncbi:MAG: DEAD/DEAH box helicase family protein, partial [SAR324 cluster bacterium]|nr:DEAD/DEAH box helicase family protein [SAR324 cluster bacterium]
MSVYLTPEDKARVEIDGALNRAGWNVQNYKDANLGASLGVVLRFVPLKNRKEADYVLFLNRKPVGVIEAKAEGTTLSGVAEQSETYLGKLADSGWSSEDDLRFHYESTGTETFFRDRKDPDSRSRRVFSFHRPETLQEWLCESDTLRGRLRSLPVLVETDLWNCQKIAIKNLEKSFSEARPKALIQMSMGSGKTYTAITFIYRLIKFGGARRVLFLVDRRTLGIKTKREFQSFATPDDGRKFTEIYNVQHLTSNVIDPVCRVTIATIQRVYAMLKGEEIDPELEDQSAFDGLPLPASPKEVVYNGNIPIEAYDFIVVDECHRSIYNLWRQVLEYFDSFLVGLTATPTKYTIGYFDQNLVMEYPHDRAVADGVNVGYDTYIINTRITSQGATVDAGEYVDKRHRVTRSVRWEQLDDDLTYQPTQLD